MFFIPDFPRKNKCCEGKIKIPGALDAPYLAMKELVISQTIVSKKRQRRKILKQGNYTELR